MNLLPSITKEVKHFFSNSKGSHDFSHVERVYNLAVYIGKKEKADLEIIKLAALLHDIGREEEDKCQGKVCHAERGAKMAGKILRKYNLSENKIAQIAHCIAAHRFRGSKFPQSKEAKVLFDADKLDSIGAAGISRAFLFAGEIGAKVHNAENIDVLATKPYTAEDTAYREFMVKLRNIKERMMTREGKRLAKERHEFMMLFFERLKKEIGGKV